MRFSRKSEPSRRVLGPAVAAAAVITFVLFVFQVLIGLTEGGDEYGGHVEKRLLPTTEEILTTGGYFSVVFVVAVLLLALLRRSRLSETRHRS